MRNPHRPAFRVRPPAAVLVLLAHGALLAVLMLVEHRPREHRTSALQFVSLWPEDHEPPEAEPAPERAVAPASSPRALAVAPLIETPPAPAEEPRAQAPPTADGPAPPAVDWNSALRSAVQNATAPKEGPERFSPPAQALRKPCEPPKSSFEWNPEEPRAGLLPLPFVRIGERCVVGLGFFSCTLGELPPPNGKLFDDMQAGKGSESSVPDPHVCD